MGIIKPVFNSDQLLSDVRRRKGFDPVNRMVAGKHLFAAGHRYQFLLFYLIPYLRILNLRRNPPPEKYSRGKLRKAYLFGQDCVFEVAVGVWIIRWMKAAIIGKPVGSLLVKNSILELNDQALFSYIRYLKELSLPPGKQNIFRKRNAILMDWMVPKELDVDAYFQYLKILRPPLTDTYVLAGMIYIHTQYRQHGSAYWTNRWSDLTRYLTGYCDHNRYQVPVERQLSLLERYTTYLNYVKKYSVKKALFRLSEERQWKHRSTEQKEIFMLNKFFPFVEVEFKKFEFQRQDYLLYLKRILKKIQSGKGNIPKLNVELIKYLEISYPPEEPGSNRP